jgi:hypothetical protein
MSRLRLFFIAPLAALALAGPGCGGSDEKYLIPADNQLHPFTPPEEEELNGAEAEAAPDEDDWSGEAPAAAPDAPAAPAAAAPAAEPAKAARPGKPGKAAKPATPAAPAKQGSGSGSP